MRENFMFCPEKSLTIGKKYAIIECDDSPDTESYKNSAATAAKETEADFCRSTQEAQGAPLLRE